MDPVTRGMSIVLHIVHVDIDVHYWSQLISFVMIGVMVSLTIRGFLLKLQQVRNVLAMELFDFYFSLWNFLIRVQLFTRLSSLVTSTHMALAMTQIMGMYFVATIVLIRMNIPAEYRFVSFCVPGLKKLLHF